MMTNKISQQGVDISRQQQPLLLLDGRRGFTLVELLAVVAIIGLLVGMLLPAVVAVRETARRSICLNNLAQISLALHNYEFTMEHFPAGVTDPKGPIVSVPPGQHVSFLVDLLPYLEQTNVSRNFDRKLGAYAAANAAVRLVQLETYVCPSDYAYINDQGTAALTNYAGCHHGSETPIDADNNGILFLNSKIGFDQIPDGSSNTILVGEFLPWSNSLGWVSGTRSSLRNTGGFISSESWSQQNPTPPPANIVGGFGSRHPSGANMALADGGVRFVAMTISLEVLSNLGNRKDEAMLGRW